VSDYALVTDSSCSLPPELVGKYGISVVPIYIEWQGGFVRDGVDVDPAQIYGHLRAHPEAVIKSSTPSPAEFATLYDVLLSEHDQVLSVHLAASLTSIVNIARQAAEAREPGRIEVVDTRTASMGLGFALLAAARAREAGADRVAAARQARAVGEAARLFGLMETVKYVRSSGRLRGLGVKAGSSLRLRPLILVADGQVRFLGVVRTRSRGIVRLMDLVRQQSGSDPVRLAVVHAGAPDEAEELAGGLAAELDCVEMIVSAFTPVLGGHTGPGFIGVTVCKAREGTLD
jgi:DegV family protein with EDD domain